jgi:putative ABC transport system permease protein
VADTMAERYFDGKDPIGEQISVTLSDGSIQDFTIVGVYKYSQALFGKVDTSVPEKDRSTYLFIPLQTAAKLQGSDQSGYDYFNLLLTPLADVEQVTAEVQAFFDEIYADNENFQINTYNMQSDMGMINTVLNVITIAVSGIAAISLIVGGVGVMNIMLVSITERTREIGVRMALGAKRRTIRMQFVIEAIVLCLIGGIIGVLIGVGLGTVLGGLAGMVIQSMYSEYSSYIILSVHPSAKAIILSLFFSMLIGVFFGYYPANKASKMEVIDALRYE